MHALDMPKSGCRDTMQTAYPGVQLRKRAGEMLTACPNCRLRSHSDGDAFGTSECSLPRQQATDGGEECWWGVRVVMDPVVCQTHRQRERDCRTHRDTESGMQNGVVAGRQQPQTVQPRGPRAAVGGRAGAPFDMYSHDIGPDSTRNG